MSENSLNIDLLYDWQLFSEEMISQILEHFQLALENFVFRLESPLSEVSLLSDKERHKFLYDWNTPTESLSRLGDAFPNSKVEFLCYFNFEYLDFVCT